MAIDIRLDHRFVDPEDNQSLMEEVGKEELLRTLYIFQNDKILIPNRLPIEFFLNCYDLTKEDLCRLVEATWLSVKFFVAFNTTFIVLISKTKNPTNFENFPQYHFSTISIRSFQKLFLSESDRFCHAPYQRNNLAS